MSRTLKDRPNYMRELDNLRKNKIDHDHTPRSAWRGNGEYYRSPIWSVNGMWKREFMAHETPALREFKASLDAEGYGYDEEVVLRDTRLEEDFVFGNHRDDDHRYREITVVKPYKLEKNKFRHTKESCSAEHLALGPGNYRWWIDTRDGLLANCTPVADRRSSVPAKVKNARAIPRTNAKQAMWGVVKEYNSGVMEEDFDNKLIYENRRVGYNTCPCCW